VGTHFERWINVPIYYYYSHHKISWLEQCVN